MQRSTSDFSQNISSKSPEQNELLSLREKLKDHKTVLNHNKELSLRLSSVHFLHHHHHYIYYYLLHLKIYLIIIIYDCHLL